VRHSESSELRQLGLTAVREGSGQLVLREIEDRDLGVLFEHWTDREAIRMAAFTSPDQNDRAAFERRWARLRSDVSTTNRVVEIDGRVVGHIASFDLEGRREVTYWIGREDWGRGIATRALQEFLRLEAGRPLYAGAASDNAASIRVLTKCGFRVVGEGRTFVFEHERHPQVTYAIEEARGYQSHGELWSHGHFKVLINKTSAATLIHTPRL